MKSWIKKREVERRDLLRLIAGKTSLPDYMIEKDFWVTIALQALFGSEIGEHLAFKGGTSLSKSWQLLNRFSEDVDIVISKKLFGYSDEEQYGKAQRERMRDKANKYNRETVVPLLQKRILELGIPATTFKLYAGEYTSSDQDPTVLWLDYQPVVEITNTYTLPQVKIEIGIRAMMEPLEIRKVMSLLSAFLEPDEFAYVPSVLPQRTFWEKSFLLHELFQKPLENITHCECHVTGMTSIGLIPAGLLRKPWLTKNCFMPYATTGRLLRKFRGLTTMRCRQKHSDFFPRRKNFRNGRLTIKK